MAHFSFLFGFYGFNGLFGFFVRQEIFQRVQLIVPEYPVLFDPLRYLVQLLQFRLAVPFPAHLFDGDESALGQYLDMFGDSGAAYLELIRHSVQIH